MYKKFVCLFLMFGMIGCSSLNQQRNGDTFPPESLQKGLDSQISEPSKDLIVGEKFFYKMRWLGFDVGSVYLSVLEKVVVNERPAYHIQLTAATNKFFSFFYKVTSEVNSYLDAETFQPIKHFSDVKVNKKVVFKKINYDFTKMIAYSEDKKGKYEIKIKPDTLGPLGIFYYFRLHNVDLSKAIDLQINGGKKNFLVRLIIKKMKMVNVPIGKFQAFLVSSTPQSERQFDDILHAPGTMTILVSTEERRLPLLITLKVPVGTAYAILSEISYPDDRAEYLPP